MVSQDKNLTGAPIAGAPLNPERPFNWGGSAAIIILVPFCGFYLKLVLSWFMYPFKGFPLKAGFKGSIVKDRIHEPER